MTRVVGVIAAVVSLAMSSAVAGEWRFSPGLTYMGGFTDVGDFYERQGYEVSTIIPVAIAFKVDYLFYHGSIAASGPAAGVGPIAMLLGDVSYFEVPLVLTYGVKFMPQATVGPYVRAGLAYHIAGGDDVAGRSPGLFAAVGAEILQNKRVAIGVEIATDSSTVTLEDSDWPPRREKIKTGNLLVSVRAVF